MNTAVIGCGRWGSFMAWYGAKLGHRVMLYGRQDSTACQELVKHRQNECLELPQSVEVTNDLGQALEHGDMVLIAIGAQNLRSLCKEIRNHNKSDNTFILCMKGLESSSGRRLSQVFHEELPDRSSPAVWLGPGHVQDFVRGIPNCMLVGSDDISITKRVIGAFSSELIRFYIGQDMIGNEIGAAAKNVMGIAAGMLDGLDLSPLKGALMARGAREIARLVRAMGGNEMTVYGLSHLGDYQATLFSPHSQNRKFGEAFVTHKAFKELAEGVATIRGLLLLSAEHNTDLPICGALASIICDGESPLEVLRELLLRPIKSEL